MYISPADFNSLAIDREVSLASAVQKGKTVAEKGTGDEKAIRKLSEESESLFLEIVLKSMRQSVPKSDFLKESNGEEIFRTMLDGEYAKSFAQRRESGIAKSIEDQLLFIYRNGSEKETRSQLQVQKIYKSGMLNESSIKNSTSLVRGREELR